MELLTTQQLADAFNTTPDDIQGAMAELGIIPEGLTGDLWQDDAMAAMQELAAARMPPAAAAMNDEALAWAKSVAITATFRKVR